MRKFFVGLLSACLLSVICLPVAVRADVLLEVNDGFWKKHHKECDYYFRRYTVNGTEGYAVLWESPVSSRQEEVLANGTEIWSNWHYTDARGETWCTVQTGEINNQGYEEVSGWIKTSECLAVPDYISFREAHEQEFVEYDPAYDGAFDGLETVTLWEYPCSGTVAAEGVGAEWFRENTTPAQTFSVCWRDPQGRMWGYVSYCYGIRNTWVCLDDPSSAGLETDDSVLPRDAVIYPPADQLPPARSGASGLAAGGVLAVTAVTAALIWFFFFRKKEK